MEINRRLASIVNIKMGVNLRRPEVKIKLNKIYQDNTILVSQRR